jgi:hypothetical protein
VRKLSSLLLLVSFLDAQSSRSTPAVTPGDPESIMNLQMELFRQSVRDNDPNFRRAAATRREQVARLQFMQKANHFVELWGKFVNRLNDQQTFDGKLAKKVSKAFHDLERSDGWPLRDPPDN